MTNNAADTAAGTTRRRLWHTALTGLSQGVGFLSVAGLGLLIASQFGSSAVTDGFFIAQSIYGVALLMGQSLRTTAVSGLTKDRVTGPAETLGAVVLMALLAAVVFAVVAALVVPAVTADLPPAGTESAQQSLVLLWPAAALQLVAGGLAALLATRDRVAVSAGAYSIGSVVGLLAFLPLQAIAGATALPLVLLVTSAVSAGLLVGAVARSGGLPRVLPKLAPTTRRTGRLLLGSAGLIVGQLVVASSISLAGRVGEQAATTYSYGMMALSLITATAVTPALIVLAPVLADEWAGDTQSLSELGVRIFRFGAVIVVPAIAGVVLIGAPILGLLMPDGSSHTVHDIVQVIIVLSPTVLATLMVIIPELGLVTHGRFGVLALVGAGILPLHLLISILAVDAGAGVVGLAGVAAATTFVSASVVTAIGTGDQRWASFGGVGLALAQLVAVPVIAYVAVAELIGGVDALGHGALAWVVGTIVGAAFLLLTRRQEMLGIVGMARGTS